MRASLPLCLTLSAAFLAGCGGDKKASPGQDWSQRPLTTVKDKVKGVGFSIGLPQKMKKDEHGSEVSIGWRADMDDYFSEPSVNIYYSSIPPKDLSSAHASAMIDKKHTIARKDKIDTGFIITHHSKDKGYVKTHVWKKSGEKVLNCVASQAKRGGVPSPDKTLRWLEQICLSLSVSS
jgi:hypothetical protein